MMVHEQASKAHQGRIIDATSQHCFDWQEQESESFN